MSIGRYLGLVAVVSLLPLSAHAEFSARAYVTSRTKAFHDEAFTIASSRPCSTLLQVEDSLMAGLTDHMASLFGDDPRLKEIARASASRQIESRRREKQAGVEAERSRILDVLRTLKPEPAPYQPGPYKTQEAISHDLLIYLLDEFVKVENAATLQQAMAFVHSTGTTTVYGQHNFSGPDGQVIRLIDFLSVHVELATGVGQIDAFKTFTETFLSDELLSYAVRKDMIRHPQLFLGVMQERGNLLFNYYYQKFLAKSSYRELRDGVILR